MAYFLMFSVFIVPCVRQGSLFSPNIFNVFIKAMVINIIGSRYGCHLNRLNISCMQMINCYNSASVILACKTYTGSICRFASVQFGMNFNIKSPTV
jgi:hypothetical protein